MNATPSYRVFVSSVIEGYRDYRDAACDGIRQAGAEPVRVEDFEARSDSPRNTCIDAVRSADALVLVLGQRYGWVTPNDKSATHEEYEAARTAGVKILVFREEGVAPDERQQSFIDEVEHYVRGHFRKEFSSPTELRTAVKQAVSEAVTEIPSSGRRAHQRIREIMDDPCTNSDRRRDRVWIRSLWTSLRDEEMDELVYSTREYAQSILRLAHDTNTPLMSYGCRAMHEVTTKGLSVRQVNAEDYDNPCPSVRLDIGPDWTLAICQEMVGRSGRPGLDSDAWAESYHLKPSAVADSLNKAWNFAKRWWQHDDAYERHDKMLHQTALYNIGDRIYSDDVRPEAIKVSLEKPPSPLVVWDRPRVLSRANVADNGQEIQRILTRLELRLRDTTGG